MLAVLLLLAGLLIGFISTEWGQNWLARKATARLSRDLQAQVSIGRVRLRLLNKMDLQTVLIRDRRGDTLLSAGTIGVRITDWFIFKDEAELEYLELSDALIRLQRSDSTWNYGFLSDYFGGGAAEPTAGARKKSSGIDFNLKEVALRRVRFEQLDRWLGTDLTASLDSLDLNAKTVSLARKEIIINSLSLAEPVVAVRGYTGRKAKDTTDKPPVTHWNPGGWKVDLGLLSIRNGTFRNDVGTGKPAPNGFDGQHLHFTAINGTLRDAQWRQDTITARVALRTRERSGLEVRDLQSAITVHPRALIFDELLLRTERSRLGQYLAMRFPSFEEMSDFINAVQMEARFGDALIASDDIAYFAPAVRDWNKNIRLSGHVRGTVASLTAEDMEIRAGANTYVRGDLSLQGLPDINSTFIDLRAAELRTTYRDATSFVPALRNIRTPNLAALGTVRFTGNYTGFINDFVTFGTLQTGLGTLTTDLNLKLPARGEPVYSGTISTGAFRLGTFINNNDLGSIAFNGKVNGRSFSINRLDLTLDGTIQRVEFRGYPYRNLTAKGRLKARQFEGAASIRDPNASLSLRGLIDFSGKEPLFNAEALVDEVNLQALGLTKEAIRVGGRFDLNMQGASLSTLLGTARIHEARLVHNGSPLSFDSLVVRSGYVDGLKTLRAVSNELDATVTGTFDLQALPDAFTLFLSRYYPSYIRAPRNVAPQAFTFDINTGQVDEYIRLVHPKLSGFSNSQLKGSLDIASNNMTIDADIPQFGFGTYSFSDVQLRGTGDLQQLVLTGGVNNARITDSLVFPQTTFSITAGNDVSDITLNTSANTAINSAALSARINTFSDGATILFNPSTFIVNGKTWTIETGGELNLRRNTDVQGQLVLRESVQEIRVYTEPSGEGAWNDLQVEVRNLNLGDLSPLVLPSNRLEGALSGKITIEDPQNRLNISGDITTEGLRLDNDSIGAVQAGLNYNSRSGLLTGNGGSLNPDQRIDFDLSLDFNDSANLHRDRISVKPKNYPVRILERFIGGLFSDLRGTLTGNLDILGEGANRDFIGRGRLSDAGLRVNFTKVFYHIADTEIELREDAIDLGTLNLRDTLGHTAVARGVIRHKGFQNVYYDIEARSTGAELLLLNTTLKDNQTFFGTAFGTGSLNLVGPQSDMFMNINVRASAIDSSYITLPPSRTRASSQATFLVERQFGRELNERDIAGQAANLNFEVSLTATPLVNMEVILDELTGDVIRGRGNGTLRINSGTSAPLAINGRFDIEEGSYLFTFQSFFKRPFVLRPGNNYIEWTGDPYDANIRMEAEYTAERVSFAPLATTMISTTALGGQGQNLDYNNLRSDVQVIATLTGKLFSPKFDFELQLPPNSTVTRDPSIAFVLQQIERNPNELTKQVTYLIVANSFAPYEGLAGSSGFALREFTSNTISGLLFGEVNRQLNQLLGKVLSNNNLTLNLSGSLYNSNPLSNSAVVPFTSSNVNVALGGALFNGRASFTVGGTFDVPILATVDQQFRLLPDVTVNLRLNESGSFQATFFYRDNLSYLNGGNGAGGAGLTTNRYGASLQYAKEFDSITETVLNKKKKRKNKKADSQQPTVNSPQ